MYRDLHEKMRNISPVKEFAKTQPPELMKDGNSDEVVLYKEGGYKGDIVTVTDLKTFQNACEAVIKEKGYIAKGEAYVAPAENGLSMMLNIEPPEGVDPEELESVF